MMAAANLAALLVVVVVALAALPGGGADTDAAGAAPGSLEAQVDAIERRFEAELAVMKGELERQAEERVGGELEVQGELKQMKGELERVGGAAGRLRVRGRCGARGGS